MNELYEPDVCYECGGYGDDYSMNENGDLVCNCDTCPFSNWEDDPWDE